MGLILGIVVVQLVLLLAAVLAAGVFYGRTAADARYILDSKRRERRRERQFSAILANMSVRAGLGPLAPRNEPQGPVTGGKPARRVVPQSESVQRAMRRDRQFADDHPGTPLPPAISVPKQVPSPEGVGAFLADVTADLNGRGRNNHSQKGE